MLTATVKHHLAWLDLDTVPEQPAIRSCREGDNDRRRRKRDGGHTRECFLRAYQVQAGQLCPGQLRTEDTRLCDDEFGVQVGQARLVIVGIDESTRGPLRHRSHQ